MSLIKKIFAVALIGGSLVLGFLIISDSRRPLVIETKKTEGFDALAPRTESAPLLKNSTKEVAQEIAEELLRRNPEGPALLENGSGIKAIRPDEIVGKIFSDRLENLDLSEFNPQINGNALKIIKSSDKKLAENYFKNFRAILQNNFSKISADFSNPAAKDLRTLAAIYGKSIAAFYNLLVPEDLAGIHSEEIRLLSIQKAVFENLGNYEADPVKALVALQVLTETDRLFAALNKEMNGYILKNNLKI